MIVWVIGIVALLKSHYELLPGSPSSSPHGQEQDPEGDPACQSSPPIITSLLSGDHWTANVGLLDYPGEEEEGVASDLGEPIHFNHYLALGNGSCLQGTWLVRIHVVCLLRVHGH